MKFSKKFGIESRPALGPAFPSMGTLGIPDVKGLIAPALAFSSAWALAWGIKNFIKTPNSNGYNAGCRTRIKAILDALESL